MLLLKTRIFAEVLSEVLRLSAEAVKNLPSSFRKSHQDLPWAKIAGMRDVLIHHYFGVNYKMVWDVVKNQVPDLKIKISRLLDND